MCIRQRATAWFLSRYFQFNDTCASCLPAASLNICTNVAFGAESTNFLLLFSST